MKAETIWTIRLSRLTISSYMVKITGEGSTVYGIDSTPDGAYRLAESKLIIKPGFVQSIKLSR